MRRFSVGEVVTWIPDLLLRSETHGDYRIVAAMPDRDGDHMYRIKSPLEEYERVVKEDLLVKSTGYLPEEAPVSLPAPGRQVRPPDRRRIPRPVCRQARTRGRAFPCPRRPELRRTTGLFFHSCRQLFANAAIAGAIFVMPDGERQHLR